MRKLVCSALIILLCTSLLKAQQQLIYDFLKNVVIPEQTSAAARIDVLHTAPTSNYDLNYQRCEWTVSPDTLFIAGTITSYFTLVEDAAFIYFDASDALIIDSAKMDDDPILFEHSNNELKLIFPSSLNQGDNDSVIVFYHGIPVSSGFGSFAITPHETGNTIWTLSEPYGASDWWPCKQTLEDKLDSVDVFVTTPSQYRSGGPGLLINEISNDGFTTYHWKSIYPIATYLIGIAISNYDVYQFYAPHHEDSVLFYNLLYPENFDVAVEGINAIVPSFELFSDIYGDYSFAKEKYGHMQFGWGGGMEHQTMSSVTNFNYELLVHEMAHQWFGDKITCATWRDIWLNEGFATYSTWLSYDLSDDPLHYFEAWLTGTRSTIISKPDGSVWVDDTTSTSRIFDGRLTYYKGAWLLHMLRWELGDEHFFEGIKNYITDPMLEYNFAHTENFIDHLEAVSDTSLTEFFNDWFYGQGFPSYHLLWNQDEHNYIRIALDQTTSNESVNFFEMKVPVRLIGDNDSLDVVLDHKKIGQIFTIHTSFTVNQIKLDPDIKILHGNDVIVKTELPEDGLQVIIYPNPVEGILNLQLFSTILNSYEIFLFDAAGRQVIYHSSRLDGSRGLVKLDVTDLASGIYLLKVTDADNEFTQKVVIK